MLLYLLAVGKHEHEGNAEFVVFQSIQFLSVDLHGELSALFPEAFGEGDGIVILVDGVGRVLDVNVQGLDGLRALVVSGTNISPFPVRNHSSFTLLPFQFCKQTIFEILSVTGLSPFSI